MHENNDRIINNEVLPLYCIPIRLCAVGSVLCSNPVVYVCVLVRWETLDSFMQHDVQELCRVVSFRTMRF